MDTSIKTLIESNIAGHNDSVIDLVFSALPDLLLFGLPVAVFFYVLYHLFITLRMARR